LKDERSRKRRYNRGPTTLQQEDPMQSFAPLAAIVLALSVASVQAATPTSPADTRPTEVKASQQSRMKTCNAGAKVKELRGADRKAFMSECLKKKA
jgi:hypothetical protein